MAEDKPSRRPTRQFKPQPPGEETVRPPFDPEEFARDSESRLRIGDVIPPAPRTPVPPEDDPPPSSQSETRLTNANVARADVPAPDAVPFRAMAPEDLEWFELDGEATTLLDRVNGLRPIAKIADAVGLPAALACAVFMRLAKDGIVGFR